MITTEEYIEALQGVKRPLIKAHDEITGVADFIEARLQTEKEFADSRVYGTVCYVPVSYTHLTLPTILLV